MPVVQLNAFVSTSAAARILRVEPNVLRIWEETFGFPQSSAGPHGHRRFASADIFALATALQTSASIPGAIKTVQRTEWRRELGRTRLRKRCGAHTHSHVDTTTPRPFAAS